MFRRSILALALLATASAAPARTSLARSIAATRDLSAFAGAIRSAGLTQALAGPGPFTVFAPGDPGFANLPEDVAPLLAQPGNRQEIARVVAYHVVAGALSSAELRQRITTGGGSARLTTIEGEPLVVTLAGATIQLSDVNGNTSLVELADQPRGNGLLYRISGVLVPRMDVGA